MSASAKDISLEEYHKLVPTCTLEERGHRIRFYTPSPHVKALVDTIFVAEPETIDWISHFDPEDIYLDIGANIGLYSLWATVSRHVQCYAFEPESLNYSILTRNIIYNDLGDRLIAYPAAIGDKSGFDQLHLTIFEYGETCHALGKKLNYANEPFEPVFSQGCYTTTIDELISSQTIPVPNHIKIDVDGIENEIIEGARQTLKTPNLRSLLIEVNGNSPRDISMIKDLEALDFIPVSYPPSPLAPIDSIYNVVFKRNKPET